MIPTNRPVVGNDINDLRIQYGLSTADACYLFGMSMAKWSKIVCLGRDEPVTDVPLALFARLLDANPWLYTPPEYPSPNEMKELFQEASSEKINQRTISILLGADGSSAHRWLKLGSRQGPSVQRLMLYLEQTLLSANDPATRAQALSIWKGIVEAEGYARTGKDVFKTGKWRLEDTPETDESFR